MRSPRASLPILRAMGGVLSADDLINCKARVLAALSKCPGARIRCKQPGRSPPRRRPSDVLRQMADTRIAPAPDAQWYVSARPRVEGGLRATARDAGRCRTAGSGKLHHASLGVRRGGEHGGDNDDAALLDGKPRRAAEHRHPHEQRGDVVRPTTWPSQTRSRRARDR